MEGDPIVIRPEDVEADRPRARQGIQSAGLPRLFAASAPGPYGTTRGALSLLEALEASLATGLATARCLLARVERGRASGLTPGVLTPKDHAAAVLVGLGIFCQEVLGATGQLAEAALPERPFVASDVAAILAPDGDDFAPALCRDLAGYVEHYKNHVDSGRRLGDADKLAACVRSHLQRLLLCVQERYGAPEHETHRSLLDALELKAPKSTYRGLTPREEQDEEHGLLDIQPEDIVGNQEVLTAAMKLARAVASFDVKAGKNPRAVDNPVLFVLGSPGCGKTATAHAVGRYFLGLCREAGLPARFRVIRKTDWASHYQNKSANDLLRIFQEEVFTFPGVCGCYWPDIDTAFAARSDPDIRQEEKSNLAALFGILDGTIGPRNGRWFLFCDANYLQMDEAMLSRLTQDPKIAKGPETPADYVRLLRDLKLRKWRHLLPTAEAWDAIGEVLHRSGVSGRAVAAIAGRVVAEIQDVPEPPGFFQLSYEEKVKVLETLARPITRERILEQIDHYIRFDRAAQERAHRERFEQRVEEIRLQLSAHAAATRAPFDERKS